MAITAPNFSAGFAGQRPAPTFNFQTAPQAPAGQDWLSKLGTFANSPAGQAGIGAVGGLLAARDQNAQSDKQLASTEAMNSQRLQADMLAQQQNDQRQRQMGVLDANPLGAMQNFAAKQALMSGIAGMAGGSGFRPTDPGVAAAMPSGGFSLPPEVVAQLQKGYGPEATAASIGQRQMDLTRLDPGMGDAGVLGSLGLGDTSSLAEHLATFKQQQQDQSAADQQKRDALFRALDNNPTGQTAQPEAQKGTPWWKKALKVAAVAAPIVAAPFTGGTSLALIGAGSGAASGLLNGGGLKGAVLGAGLGAATGGMGGGAAGGAAQRFTAGAAAKTLLNPRALATVGSQVVPGKAGAAMAFGSQFAPTKWRG